MGTEYMVYWTDGAHEGGTNRGKHFTDMNTALAFMQVLREVGGATFVALSSESVDNVGKMGVDAVVDGVCPDGEAFLGRTSRHGMQLKRGR